MFENRRDNARFGFEVVVDLTSASGFWMGLSQNLSEGGLFIASANLVPIGENVHVRLDLSDGVGAPFEVDCEVAWHRLVDDEDSGIRPGMGVRFLYLDASAQARIMTFCRARREAQFFDLD